MNEQKTLLTLSLVLNFLLILTISFIVIVYFNFWGLAEKLGVSISNSSNNGGNVATKEEITDEVSKDVDTYADWNVYTNEEIGFKIKYPKIEIVDDNTVSLALIEREHYRLREVNCVEIGPVDNDQKAQISIGYAPADNSPDMCFRSGVGGGELTVEYIDVMIGNETYEVKETTYTGLEESEESFVQYKVLLENPNMNDDECEYFAIEVEYWPEYESLYSDLYKEILKTFEWL
jgi:translation elongation factor EF-1beta